MEHLILWLIHALIKAVTQKPKTEPQAHPHTQPVMREGLPTDPWADYRRKQAAIERDMAAKSPSISKR